MRRGFELSLSTIAMVVALLVVLLLVGIFFTSGFGEAQRKVSGIRDTSIVGIESETAGGGALDIEGLITKSTKKWCIGNCTTDSDCCPTGGSPYTCSCECSIPTGKETGHCTGK